MNAKCTLLIMRRRLLLSVVVVAVFTLSSCVKEKKIIVANNTSADRYEEVIVLDRNTVESRLAIGADNLLPAVKTGDRFVPSQADDMDGDGRWDELAFMVDLKAGESLPLHIVYLKPEEYPSFVKRTNAYLGIEKPDGSFAEVDYYAAPPPQEGFRVISQSEGPVWENDKIGFRVYFDCRNVKDLFGKLQPVLIAHKVETPGMGSYHDLADWGMDVLHCGSSLGAGGLAILEKDSLYRLGSTDTYEYRKIASGPVRSVCDLIYGGWDVAGEKLAAVERLTIYPGKYWFRSDVTVSGFQGTKDLVTGIVTSLLKNDPVHRAANDDYDVIATHDKQSLNDDNLGMAVMLPKTDVCRVGRTSDINFFALGHRTVPEKNFSHVISETYYIAQHINNNKPAPHYFFAVWGLEKPQWNTMDGFMKYITEEAQKLSNPVEVSFTD